MVVVGDEAAAALLRRQTMRKPPPFRLNRQRTHTGASCANRAGRSVGPGAPNLGSDCEGGTVARARCGSFMLDGKQYISVTGGSAGGTGAAPAPRLPHLVVLALDGNEPIPAAPAN